MTVDRRLQCSGCCGNSYYRRRRRSSCGGESKRLRVASSSSSLPAAGRCDVRKQKGHNSTTVVPDNSYCHRGHGHRHVPEEDVEERRRDGVGRGRHQHGHRGVLLQLLGHRGGRRVLHRRPVVADARPVQPGRRALSTGQVRFHVYTASVQTIRRVQNPL